MKLVRSSPGAHETHFARGWVDAALFVGGFGLLVLSALPVRQHSVSPSEAAVFHAINAHTVLPFSVVWPVMQLGNFLVVPVAALAVALLRRWRLAVGILLGGGAAYLIAKVVKRIVIRGRPATLLTGVDIRGEPALGSGFVSGHAAVVTLIATLAWPYLRRRGRITVVALATVVGLARVYVGAHLPLDVLGGAALGLGVAGAVRLLLGRPVRC
jgi:undecaprenyl-diphosphatase